MPRNKRRTPRNPRSSGRNQTSLTDPGRRAQAPTVVRTPNINTIARETLPVFPPSKFVPGQLYYDSNFSTTGTAGILTRYVFSANGIYDPDITGTGHQPIGFDQMMLFYEQAVVIRSRIKITVHSAAATDIRVAIALTPDTGAPASINEAVENGYIVMDTVVGAGGGTATPGLHHTKTLTLECDVPKYFGRTRSMLEASPEFYCTAAANPTEQVYYQFYTWNPSAGVTTNTYFDVLLSFDTFYYEPRKVGTSLFSRIPRQLLPHSTEESKKDRTAQPRRL